MNDAPQEPTSGEDRGLGLVSGSKHYRAFVGPPERYDEMAANQFNFLTFLGLREESSLLDIGCGSLRAGKLFLPYLLPENYCGIEPEEWLLQEGIRKECGEDLIRIKKPSFFHTHQFECDAFKRKFDFFLAQSIFSHTSEEQIRKCLSLIAGSCHPHSLFAATFIEGPENYTGSEWVYNGCVKFTFEKMVELGEEAGFATIRANWPHPAQTWIIYTPKGNESNIPQVGDQEYLTELRLKMNFYKRKFERSSGRLEELEKSPIFGTLLRVANRLKRMRKKEE